MPVGRSPTVGHSFAWAHERAPSGSWIPDPKFINIKLLIVVTNLKIKMIFPRNGKRKISSLI